VVGLDIGTTAVRAAQVEFGSGGPTGKSTPTLSRFAQVQLPLGAVRDGEVVDQPTVSSALRQLWQQGKFDTKDVVLGIGNSRVVVRDLELPAMPLPQLKSSLPFQVNEMLPMQVTDALLDYYPTDHFAGETGSMVLGMLVAAPKDAVTTNVIAVEGASLRPTMVDLNAFALLRALARGDLAQRTVAFVDIGARTTNVVIAQQGVPRLIRILRAGGQDVTDAVASALSIAGPDAEVAKREIGVGFQVAPELTAASEAVSNSTRGLLESVRNTFTFFAQNHPGSAVEVIVLTGGGCHLPGLGQYLSSASRLPVTLGDPLATIKTGKSVSRDSFAGHASLLAVSVGLAYGVAA